MSLSSRRPMSLAIVAWIACATPPAASQEVPGGDDLLTRFTERVESMRAELIEVRRDIHRHPEISGQEVRTAGIVAARLRAAGYEVRTGVGGHGVIGILRGGRPGPLLAFRADMDAVRSNAPDPVEFRSEVDGVRHICGHDVHTAVGLALVEGFAEVRDEIAGSVMLIFQPAEETASGARAMVSDGAFADPRPEAVFAFHTAPFEVGSIATASGTLMPGRDLVRVTLRGEGDLEALSADVGDAMRGVGTVPPEAATNPVRGEFVLVQGAQPRREGARDGWSVAATLTTSSLEASAEAKRGLELALARLETEGVSFELDYQTRRIAGVTNSPKLVEAANSSARRVLGADAVLPVESLVPMFSEDFGSFQEESPGVMYFLGVSNAERGWVGMPHSPGYVADEEAIFVGARAMAAVFLDLFENGLPAG